VGGRGACRHALLCWPTHHGGQRSVLMTRRFHGRHTSGSPAGPARLPPQHPRTGVASAPTLSRDTTTTTARATAPRRNRVAYPGGRRRPPVAAHRDGSMGEGSPRQEPGVHGTASLLHHLPSHDRTTLASFQSTWCRSSSVPCQRRSAKRQAMSLWESRVVRALDSSRQRDRWVFPEGLPNSCLLTYRCRQRYEPDRPPSPSVPA
jgi:hypothetical protein